jgi:pyruvate kinase
MTPNQTTYDRLALAWGVTPMLAPTVATTDELISIGEQVLLDAGQVQRGQEVVALAGNTPMKGATNTMRVYTVGVR